MADRSDNNIDHYGTHRFLGTRSTSSNLETYTLEVDFSDLGSGGSDTIPLTGFPTDVLTFGVGYFVPTSQFAGEADLAFAIGDTGDADGYCASTTLDAMPAGTLGRTAGAQQGVIWEADWAADGAAITFTATQLDDVTAGHGFVHVPYIQMRQCADA